MARTKLIRTPPSFLWTAVALFLCCRCSSVVAQSTNSNDILYDGCNEADYYADLLLSSSTSDDITLWTRDAVTTLLTNTHRKTLPYTNSDKDDVWKALIDLDPGDSSSTVRLIYNATDSIPARPFGTPATWNREHVWPKSRGVDFSGQDFTDIHHLRPADWSVNSARGNKFFGNCSLFQESQLSLLCKTPAHPEAAADTSTNSLIFLPPTVHRGEIARAVLYMDVRYSSSNNGGSDLVLTDCPDESTDNELAYLSVLLDWHEQYPPTNSERRRNQRACERWQGNRNIFVDYPELASVFFDNQRAEPDGAGGFVCDQTAPVPAPIPVFDDRSACAMLEPGDVMVVAVQAESPATLAFVALQRLKGGLELTMTDKAWNGTQFSDTQGSLGFTVPGIGIAAGTVFGFGTSVLHGNDWQNVSSSGEFTLETDGDSVMLYCLEDEADGTSIRHLGALTYTDNDWMDPGLTFDAYGNDGSALPDSLTVVGSTSLPAEVNSVYQGPLTGSKQDIQDALADETLWEGTNDTATIALPEMFTVINPLSPGDVMVVALNSDNPDLVALVALNDIPGDMELFLTDNAWTGSEFRTNEGTLVLSVPPSGIARGTVFGYGPAVLFGDDWIKASGSFALSASGDTVFVYYQDDEGGINHLGAFSFKGAWEDEGLDESAYGTGLSALPESLVSIGSTSLPHKDNYVYIGPTNGGRESLQDELNVVENWEGSNTEQVSPPIFAVVAGNTPSSSDRVLPWWTALAGLTVFAVATAI